MIELLPGHGALARRGSCDLGLALIFQYPRFALPLPEVYNLGGMGSAFSHHLAQSTTSPNTATTTSSLPTSKWPSPLRPPLPPPDRRACLDRLQRSAQNDIIDRLYIPTVVFPLSYSAQPTHGRVPPRPGTISRTSSERSVQAARRHTCAAFPKVRAVVMTAAGLRTHLTYPCDCGY